MLKGLTMRMDRIEQQQLKTEIASKYELAFGNPPKERSEGPLRGGYSRGGERTDVNVNSIKFKIPPFQGCNDPNAYLEWEYKIELIFSCHNYSEEKKVKLDIVEFSGYASIWWDQLTTNRRRYLERLISTWQELRQIIRKRFIPSCYYRDLFRQL